MRLSPCGRFVVLEHLHVDREVLSALAQWTERRGLRVQDGIQLAIVAFTEALLENAESSAAALPTSARPGRWSGRAP